VTFVIIGHFCALVTYLPTYDDLMLCTVQEEIVAKFVWLGQKLGLVSKPKVDDDGVDVDGQRDAAGSTEPSSQPPVAAIATFPTARPVGSFNPPGHLQMPAYAGGMYPRYGNSDGSAGAVKPTGMSSGSESPLTKRAAAVLAATSNNKH